MTGDSNKECISICSLNVRGLADARKRKDLFMWLRNKKYNIYCLQDIHCDTKKQNLFRNEWGGEALFSSIASNSRGVAVLFSNNFEYSIVSQLRDDHGNLLGVKLNVEDQNIGLITLYGPNRDDPLFYRHELSNMIQLLDANSYIVCGDFNLVQNQDIDTQGYLHENNRKASVELKTLKELNNLTDPWRSSYPDKREYTWRNPSNSKTGRLDFFLVSDHFMPLVMDTIISFGYKTDHSLVTLFIKISDFRPGKGFWKLNVSLLRDASYIALIKSIITETASEYNKNVPINCNEQIIDDNLFWETLKMKIRSASIKYSSQLKRDKAKEQKYLETSINILERGLFNARNEVRNLYQQYKSKLEAIRESLLEGAMIRSRSRWLELGEKPTKYFCGLEKRNYTNKSIRKLVLENNEILVSPKDILDQQRLFYKSLYTSRNKDVDTDIIKNFVNQFCLKKLSDDERETFEKEITEDEIKLAMKGMKQNKSPGSDGLPIEFYKMFWPDIGRFLINSYHHSYRTGTLSINQKRGIITCIPKSSKNRTLLKNWRPISLLNSDYKLISNVFANRIKIFLPKLIHSDQKGFIQDRFIGENTRLVYDIIQNLKENNKSGILLLLDFEKAFDSVEWRFIEQTLTAFNFGQYFLDWFKILYHGSESCVINNGTYSEFFRLERGCRQGDPISPYLFILASEILANSIRVNNSISGIRIKNIEFKLGQYADDTFIFLNDSRQSLLSTINCLDVFKQYSGLKINLDKCEMIWLGNKRGSLDELLPGIKVSSEFKLLGIKFPLI